MTLLAVVGTALTLITLGGVFLGGLLIALRLLPAGLRATDTLAFASAALLAATAEAVGIALVLGAAGRLFLPWALALQLLLVVVLLRWPRRLGSAELRQPLAQLAARGWARLREHPALAVITLSALGSEALRGLLRPPLSWDSLMYHLLLTANWVQTGSLRPVFGYHPVNYYGFVPANGSLWLWWWMAPSHSELFANLAFFPPCLLLALATGGIARQLGARRWWPLASFLVLLTPTVERFAASQYVDVFLSSALLAAGFLGCLWLREPRAATAALAGAGLGLAAGAKVLGAPYGALLASSLVALAPIAPGSRARRFAHVLLAAALAAGLGSYFYLRNMALGAGPLALVCEHPLGAPGPSAGGVVPLLPRPQSLLGPGGPPDRAQQAMDALLGITVPRSAEMGIGPPALLLLLLAPLLPLALPRGHRREGLVAASQVAFEAAFWVTVPDAYGNEIYANVRYLIPAIGLLLAAGAAVVERFAVSAVWLEVLALALAAQGLLQLHAEMPPEVRLAVAILDVALVALAFAPRLRDLARHHAGAVAAAALVLVLAGAAPFARFRVADRDRALEREWSIHATFVPLYAPGWAWLDRHGGGGTVAVASGPSLYFVYPAMGPFLERRVLYVNVNRADLANAAAYPRCNPRVDPEPAAWLANLQRAGVRWLLVNRFLDQPFPLEQSWARAAPGLFALRFADGFNQVYELQPSRSLPSAP
ncbi:MAG TPA: hypothetical protein VHG32_02655 [Thermoanaerobaculia bacterium]|jgi:hypothetical protein|nr:hypothetical protein [Thermoanaerobaculia bacterium]